MEIAVVMPVYNEEANIEAVVGEWVAELERLDASYRLYCVNDGSRDNTANVLQQLASQYGGRVTVIEQENAGHGLACRKGYEQAVAEGHAWTLQIDSDGQCDPRFLGDFMEGAQGADCVFGLRTSRDDGKARAVLSSACRLLSSALAGVDLLDANVPYRLMRSAILQNALRQIPVSFEMQNVALTVVLKRDHALRWKYVPIHFRRRQGGSNSLNLRRVVSMGWRLLRTLRRLKKPIPN